MTGIWLLLILICLLQICFILLWLQSRAQPGALREASQNAEDLSLKGQAERLEELKRSSATMDDAYRRIRELQDAVATACRERDDWQSFYYQAASGAGAAQQMLLQERERLVRQVIQLGGNPARDPRIDVVVADFRGHVEAASSGGRPPAELTGRDRRLGGTHHSAEAPKPTEEGEHAPA